MSPRLFLCALAVLLVSCTEADPRQLVPDAASYAPFQVVTLVLADGEEALVGEEFPGTLGEAAILLQRVDGRRLAGLIPEVPAGTHLLKVGGGGVSSAEAEVTVREAPAVPHPEATLQLAQSRLEMALTSLPASAGSTEALLEGFRAEVARLESAGGEELRQAAAFIAANPELFGVEGAEGPWAPGRSAAGLVRPWLFSSPVCDGFTAENFLTCVEVVVAVRVVLMLGTAGALGAAGNVAGALLAGFALAGQLLSLNSWLLAELDAGLIQAGKILLKDLSGQVRGEATHKSAGPGGLIEADGTLTMQNGTVARLQLTSNYRTLQPADATSGQRVLTQIADGLRMLGEAWTKVKALVGERLPGSSVTLEQLPDSLQLRTVPGDYVTVEVGPVSEWSYVEATLEGDELLIGAAMDVLSGNEFEVTLHYHHDGVSSSTTVIKVRTTCFTPELSGTYVEQCTDSYGDVTERGVEFGADGYYRVHYFCTLEQGDYWCPRWGTSQAMYYYGGSGEWSVESCGGPNSGIRADWLWDNNGDPSSARYSHDAETATLTRSDCNLEPRAASSTVPWP